MMIEGKAAYFSQLYATTEECTGPWTFKRAHVNDFSELGDTGSWEDHDWPKWTLKVVTTQVTPAHFMLECDMDPSSDNDQYLMMNKNEEGDDEIISCWSGVDCN